MKITRIAGKYENTVRHVAAYARVSTLEEEQTMSYESQKTYYESYIRSHPNWCYVGMYTDQGISGVNQKRPEFQRMIHDAKQGKIDIILVKSISRFARNAVDIQNIVHELKQCNVEVIFDEQKLSTFNRNAEMVLNMMAMIAEHESRSISRNTKWALQKQAEKGIRSYGNNHILGYDEINGTLVPNDRAWIIQYIYQQYDQGCTISDIINALESMHVRTLRNRPRFSYSTIYNILTNSIYTGEKIIQKQPPRNMYTKKPDHNIDYNSYYIEHDHEPIISKELFQSIQK
ncbi:MAG: recombinase family protein [Bulleidia sp.]